jgi:multiple sugar transport system substrate-binding protein
MERANADRAALGAFGLVGLSADGRRAAHGRAGGSSSRECSDHVRVVTNVGGYWRLMLARKLIAAAIVAAAVTLSGCGSDTSSAGPQTLSWFIAHQGGGAVEKLAEKCSRHSGGRYTIRVELLPTESDQQREQLVRRLGAEDPSLDILGLDVVWTGEFANAGWVRSVPESTWRTVSSNVFASVLETARFKNRPYAVPLWSNTQLLWYRKDRVTRPPATWDEMIDEAERIGPAKGRIQVQAKRYEGLVVLVNQLVESAGTSVLAGPQQVLLDKAPTERALAILGRLSRSPVAAANLTTSTEETAARGFEAGNSSFMINYPFVYNSAKSNRPDVFKQMRAARVPRVDPGRPSAPPIGGFNLAVSSYSRHPDLAFDAIRCLVSPSSQLEVTKLEGLPPVRDDLFDEPAVKAAYPGFAEEIRRSIAKAAPRPSESPAYQDLSLAIQRAVHPTTKIDPKNPGPTYDTLRDYLEKAIKREGLL